MTSMGVPRNQLPHWDDIQIMAAQMATKPLMEDQNVATELIVGPEAKKPLRLSCIFALEIAPLLQVRIAPP